MTRKERIKVAAGPFLKIVLLWGWIALVCSVVVKSSRPLFMEIFSGGSGWRFVSWLLRAGVPENLLVLQFLGLVFVVMAFLSVLPVLLWVRFNAKRNKRDLNQ